MIVDFKKYKLFESYFMELNSIKKKLIKYFDDSFIDNYFNSYYDFYNIQNIIQDNPDIVWNFINDEKFIESIIYDEMSNLRLTDIDEKTLHDFIKLNLSDDKIDKIKKIYSSENEDEDIEDLDVEDMLDSLGKYDYIDIIEYDGDTDNCYYYHSKQSWGNSTPKQIYYELFGYSKSNIYSILGPYIDREALKEHLKGNEDFSFKKEYVKQNIFRSRKLQEKLLDIDPITSLLLAKLFIYEKGINISNEHVFQRCYIQSKVNKKVKNLDNENKVDNIIANALKFLDDNFKLDKYISKRYEKHMWLVDAQNKYNL
jgi:hypothetical protein